MWQSQQSTQFSWVWWLNMIGYHSPNSFPYVPICSHIFPIQISPCWWLMVSGDAPAICKPLCHFKVCRPRTAWSGCRAGCVAADGEKLKPQEVVDGVWQSAKETPNQEDPRSHGFSILNLIILGVHMGETFFDNSFGWGIAEKAPWDPGNLGWMGSWWGIH